MIFDKDVTVDYDKTDRYGRLVGKIILDGTDIDLEQVKAGMAWHYKDYEESRRRRIATCMRAPKTRRVTRAADCGLMQIRLSPVSIGEMRSVNER